MKITWVRCGSYDEAKNYFGVIYLHEWDGAPFYWGKAHRCFFGGHKRAAGDLRATGRYNAGYRHWIEGCLRHGGALFIGTLDAEALRNIDEVENFLIYTYGHIANRKVHVPRRTLRIEHQGDVPASITNHSSFKLRRRKK